MSETPRTYSLADALKSASQTRSLEIGHGVIRATPRVFREYFGGKPALVVADTNTFDAAGQVVVDAFKAASHPEERPFVFRGRDLHAEMPYVDELVSALKRVAAIPVAVGSGTINDVTKLAAHRIERPYMCVGTAASMDGYTAYGASITHEGAKQTFYCPAPVAVVADLDVICAAPGLMNSWGYADLLAKVPAGADWMLADALGLEPIHPQAWAIVQGRLRELLDDPAGVRARQPAATAKLVEGLMLGGFAIEAAKSTRAASGAEHLFSHTWDMQHHTHQGVAPSHGFKVGIGTLAATALYERLLARPLERLDVEACCATWPDLDTWMRRAQELLGDQTLVAVARREFPEKYLSASDLRAQLTLLKSLWPGLRERLRAQLLPLSVLRKKLEDVGAPTNPEEIGITRARLRQTYWQTSFMRRRYMVLDVAVRTGLMDACLDEIFGPGGLWPSKA